MPEKFYKVQKIVNLSNNNGIKLGKYEINYNYNLIYTIEG